MQRPANFEKIFISTQIFVAILFVFFAVMCLYAFGEVDDGSITAYLMQHNAELLGDSYVVIANLFISFAVLFSYPLQLFPAITTFGQMKHNIKQKKDQREMNDGLIKDYSMLSDKEFSHSQRLAALSPQLQMQIEDENPLQGDSRTVRGSLVLLTFFIALSVPDVQKLISLAGALAGSSTALIIPPLIGLRFLKQDGSIYSVNMKYLSYFLLGLGITFCLIGTIASLHQILGPA